ncbi:FG-GAP repeat domain-containing protein [Alteriqipengyuania sp.]|uniref:FG-GAP repeat domain-containing protein n=1 Tax=Alteriqipengyuania sp. TaxID=2800692 RepID=UPI0035127D75
MRLRGDWRVSFAALSALPAAGCATSEGLPAAPLTVADTPSEARTPSGKYIAWREHRIDDEDLGGVPIRGGDGLQMADIDRDGFLDIVSVHEDSNHLRIAFGSADPDSWTLATVASGDIVAAIEDVSVGDLNGDGWPDLVAASEEAHLAVFRNPGSRNAARAGAWPGFVPPVTQGRGSWLRVFIADIDGDGRLDVTGANKGASDIVDPDAPREDRTTSLFTLHGDPMEAGSWREQVLFKKDVPNTAVPFDIDGDGDLDILAAARIAQDAYILENLGPAEDGTVRTAAHKIAIDDSSLPECTVTTSAFQSAFRDMNGDGRPDLVTGVFEKCGDPRAPGGLPALGWLEQPDALDAPWRYTRIGDIVPDMVIAVELTDIDGDGDLDAITGGYSGLNILKGGYTGATRDADHPDVTASSTVGRIAWFENPGAAGSEWQRHDISRRVRGMFDQFIARDMDGDGDIDLVGTRGNSGRFDGVFWLEQLRSDTPLRAFTPARANESRALPLPPENWFDLYEEANTLVAPNKRTESE